MSKKSKGELPLQESNNCPSAFTLTFVIEVLDTVFWKDCKAGWLDLGPPVNGVKLSYNLYPGQTFDVDVVIWPHVAKVFCGTNYAWVRTWQFLERRWLTFSIRHSFPVRAADLRKYEMKLIPHFGIGALSANYKNMNIFKVYLPPPQFGERRQFAEVVEAETTLKKYIGDILWALVVDSIPASNLDGPFDTPYPVKDIRHQDAALYQVQNVIVNCREKVEGGDKENIEVPFVHQKGKRTSKEITKNQTVEKVNYEIKLSGDWVLAGIGRITPFVKMGDHPTGQGEVIALISSINLPAQNDFSMFFANVGNLNNVPIEHLKQNRFTHIYTRWTISDEEHNSDQKSLQSKQHRSNINFNDHHSVPLHSAVVSDVMATFLDEPFQLELRGIRIPPLVSKKQTFFGYNKADHDYDKRIPRDMTNQDVDILIAQTRIDVRTLTKINGFIKGEFPLYPPETSLMSLNRERICTNDINAVRATVKPDLIIQPGVVLQAQMMIEVSLGLVGCQLKSGAERYSRLYCLVSNREAIKALLCEIIEINESVMQSGSKAGLLTGFGLDTGDTVMLYVEGPRKGQILRFWEKTADFYPSVKPVFSTSAFYSCRLYSDLLQATMPFIIMKMVVPLSVLLGVTPVYTRPTLPLPARSALLKIGRLIANKLESALYRRAMPTAMELKSFRLELCAPPRPPPVNDQSVQEGNMYSKKKELK